MLSRDLNIVVSIIIAAIVIVAVVPVNPHIISLSMLLFSV